MFDVRDETDRLARNGRGSNQSPGGLLHRRRIKINVNLQAPEKGWRSGRDESRRNLRCLGSGDLLSRGADVCDARQYV
jgi:hypothetical protein